MVTSAHPRSQHPRRLAAALLAAVMALVLLPATDAAAATRATAGVCAGGVRPSTQVSTPTVTGPIGDEGIRTGEPYATTLVPLADGWVEEEFFYAGTAAGHGSSEGSEADYQTRILVRRPTDPRAFNGTVLLDWTNVTIPDDTDVNWIPMHDTIMKRGFVYVAVAAQRLAIEASPLALKQWDPVRYGSLSHPGDDYSYDIFSQAAEAVLDRQVLDALTPCVQRRLALGASQSGGRLNTYINEVHEDAQVFDGFMPQLASAATVRRDVAPVLWLNSQSEVGATTVAADSGLFRMWELAGPAHTTNEYNAYTNAEIVYAHSNGNVNNYNHDEAGSWGYRADPGSCVVRNWFQAKYQFSAALVTLDRWVRTDTAPKPVPRADRDEAGRTYDEHGNLAGGVRSPLLDVPIATYFGGGVPPGSTDPCAHAGGRAPLTGLTRVFDATKLASLYSTGDDYLAQLEVAIKRARKAGYLLPEGARDIRRKAKEAAAFIDAAAG